MQRADLWVATVIILWGHVLAFCIIVWTWTCIIGSAIILGFYYSRDHDLLRNFHRSRTLRIMLRDYWNAIIYILHELLADRADFFAERGREHHDLLAVWCAAENFLHVFAHI